MTHFILIAIIFGGAGLGTYDVGRIEHIEFNSKQACEVARAVVNQHMGVRASERAELVCVPTS